MTLEEQRDTIERALGERMLNHAFVIIHQWLQEIGFQQYGDRLQSLEHNYHAVFNYYLSADDPDRDAVLDEMTAATYRLCDDVYVDVCLARGRYPQVVGFNPDNVQSVIRYFSSCARLREEDLDWFTTVALTEPRPAIALIAMAAMAHILRDCFSEEVIIRIIEAIGSDNLMIREQATATSMILLAHYDVRIDFFPHLQKAFLDAIGDGEQAFMTLCMFAKMLNHDTRSFLQENNIKQEDLPDTIRELLGEDTTEAELDSVVSWVPNGEDDYMFGMISLMPETWVFEVLVADNEQRMQRIARAYLKAGIMDMWWDNLEDAEPIILSNLRSAHPLPKDYINYGHICFLRGDKVLAYENYREARRLLGSARDFLRDFRPHRRFLVDRGISLEDVYFMEDQLLNI